MATIQTPVAGYEGHVAGVDFADGRAETDNPKAIAYFRRKGYTVDGEGPAPAGDVTASEQPDPEVKVGEPLRDAAVNPQKDDFLEPTNAGEDDPHGPTVVSPEVHGSEAVKVPGIVGGDVPSEPDAQAAKETAAVAGEDGIEPPPGNGSKDAWHAYALTQGRTTEELDGLNRDEIRELFDDES